MLLTKNAPESRVGVTFMDQDNKRPASALGARQRGLLHELDDIRTLLGDGSNDDLLDIPLLEPEGDAHTQIPLLDAALLAPTNDGPAAVERAIAERENPFLPRATIERLAQHHRQTPAAPEAGAAPAINTPAAVQAPDEQTLRALVDEVLAVWLPRIERELRERLMTQLRDQAD